MKNLKGYIANAPIFFKFLLILIFSIIIPLSIIGTFTLLSITKSNNQRIINNALRIYEQTESYLEYRFGQAYQTAQFVGVNNSIRDACAQNPADLSATQQSALYAALLEIQEPLSSVRDIVQVTLCLDSDFLFVTNMSGRGMTGKKEIEEQPWFNKAIGGYRSLHWTLTQNSEESEQNITALRPISDPNDYLKYDGYVRMDINKQEIVRFLNLSTVTEGQSAYLINGNGEVLAAIENETFEAAEDFLFSIAKKTASVGFDNLNIGNSRMLAHSTYLEIADMYYVSLIPVKVLYTEIKKLLLLWGAIITGISLYSIFLFMLLAKNITRRIRLLNNAFSSDDMEIINDNADDEIGRLTVNYNAMTEQINELMMHQFETGRQMSQMELMALQSQINPHFLYNTLNLIGVLARNGEISNLQDTISELSSYYMIALARGSDIVTIEKEVELCTIYMQLQNKRFGNTIHFKVEAEPKTLIYSIPKLTLQPLVENAIIHGILEKETGTGNVYLSISFDREDILICVRDDGVGFDEKSDSNFETRHSSGYGLINIEKRLHLYFKREKCIKYESLKGLGTSVEIRIPKRILEMQEERK